MPVYGRTDRRNGTPRGTGWKGSGVDYDEIDAGLEAAVAAGGSDYQPPTLAEGELPLEVLDWLERTVHEPKFDYIAACVDFELGRGPKPERPDGSEKWAHKVERKAERYCLPYVLQGVGA
jgi:hypothetical protein